MNRRASIALCSTFLLVASCSALGGRIRRPLETPAPGTSSWSVRTRDGVRHYLVHVPASSPRRFFFASRPPLLILLHGSGSDGSSIEETSRMDSVAERHHFVVAYPDGIRSILGRISADWNSGECCGYAGRKHIDDIAFLRAIIDDFSKRGIVDSRRVYVAGFSSGAQMAYRAGCELSDRVAAIAVVSGSLAVEHCRPPRAVSLVVIQGTGDDEVPYDEDPPDSLADPDRTWVPELPPSVRYWSALEGCTAAMNEPLSAHVDRTRFTGCHNSDVVLYTIAGGTHGWPDRDTADANDSSSAPMHELLASETIARFLLRHVLTP